MYKILIADDEIEIRNGLAKFFPWNAIGFEVAGQAENGQQAYEMLQTQHIDILLCDIVMPVLSGLELAKRLYEEKNPARIIFMSAFTDFGYARQAMEYGVKSYLLKSMHYDDLIITLSKIKKELDESRAAASADHSELPYNEKIIFRIKDYCQKNYANARLEKIASELNMSADYLGKFFKKYNEVSFSDYLMQVRMQKASEFLKDVRYKIYEVSGLVGYSNQFNFTRAFKAWFGQTPQEYRHNSSPSD